MTEIWRDIKDFEGLYQVSNFGRVRSLGNKTHSGIHLKKNYTTKYGYVVVNLSKNGKSKPYKVHRLVAEAFIPNPDRKPYINHKIEGEEGKTINVVYFNEDGSIDEKRTTIEWVTAKENNEYGTRNERSAKANTNGKLSKRVLQFTLNGELIRKWPSTKECGRNGFNQGAVAACCRGKKPHYKKCLWKYEE